MKNRILMLPLFVITAISFTLSLMGVISLAGALWSVLLVIFVLFALWVEKRHQEKLQLIQKLKFKRFYDRLNQEFPKQN